MGLEQQGQGVTFIIIALFSYVVLILWKKFEELVKKQYEIESIKYFVGEL